MAFGSIPPNIGSCVLCRQAISVNPGWVEAIGTADSIANLSLKLSTEFATALLSKMRARQATSELPMPTDDAPIVLPCYHTYHLKCILRYASIPLNLPNPMCEHASCISVPSPQNMTRHAPGQAHPYLVKITNALYLTDNSIYGTRQGSQQPTTSFANDVVRLKQLQDRQLQQTRDAERAAAARIRWEAARQAEDAGMSKNPVYRSSDQTRNDPEYEDVMEMTALQPRQVALPREEPPALLPPPYHTLDFGQPPTQVDSKADDHIYGYPQGMFPNRSQSRTVESSTDDDHDYVVVTTDPFHPDGNLNQRGQALLAATQAAGNDDNQYMTVIGQVLPGTVAEDTGYIESPTVFGADGKLTPAGLLALGLFRRNSHLNQTIRRINRQDSARQSSIRSTAPTNNPNYGPVGGRGNPPQPRPFAVGLYEETDVDAVGDGGEAANTSTANLVPGVQGTRGFKTHCLSADHLAQYFAWCFPGKTGKRVRKNWRRVFKAAAEIVCPCCYHPYKTKDEQWSREDQRTRIKYTLTRFQHIFGCIACMGCTPGTRMEFVNDHSPAHVSARLLLGRTILGVGTIAAVAAPVTLFMFGSGDATVTTPANRNNNGTTTSTPFPLITTPITATVTGSTTLKPTDSTTVTASTTSTEVTTSTTPTTSTTTIKTTEGTSTSTTEVTTTTTSPTTSTTTVTTTTSPDVTTEVTTTASTTPPPTTFTTQPTTSTTVTTTELQSTTFPTIASTTTTVTTPVGPISTTTLFGTTSLTLPATSTIEITSSTSSTTPNTTTETTTTPTTTTTTTSSTTTSTTATTSTTTTTDTSTTTPTTSTTFSTTQPTSTTFTTTPTTSSSTLITTQPTTSSATSTTTAPTTSTTRVTTAITDLTTGTTMTSTTSTTSVTTTTTSSTGSTTTTTQFVTTTSTSTRTLPAFCLPPNGACVGHEDLPQCSQCRIPLRRSLHNPMEVLCPGCATRHPSYAGLNRRRFPPR